VWERFLDRVTAGEPVEEMAPVVMEVSEVELPEWVQGWRKRARRDAFVTKIWQETWESGIVAAPQLRRWFQTHGIDDSKLDVERLPLR
jgi:hypothetical protein